MFISNTSITDNSSPTRRLSHLKSEVAALNCHVVFWSDALPSPDPPITE